MPGAGGGVDGKLELLVSRSGGGGVEQGGQRHNQACRRCGQHAPPSPRPGCLALAQRQRLEPSAVRTRGAADANHALRPHGQHASHWDGAKLLVLHRQHLGTAAAAAAIQHRGSSTGSGRHISSRQGGTPAANAIVQREPSPASHVPQLRWPAAQPALLAQESASCLRPFQRLSQSGTHQRAVQRPTLRPRCCMRFSSRSLSSGKGMMGRATRLVSSRKILVGEKGMAYRKVGSLRRAGRSGGWGRGRARRAGCTASRRDGRRHVSVTAARLLPACIRQHPLCTLLFPASTPWPVQPLGTRSLCVAGLDVWGCVQVIVPPVHEQHGAAVKGVALHLHNNAVRALVACGFAGGAGQAQQSGSSGSLLD